MDGTRGAGAALGTLESPAPRNARLIAEIASIARALGRVDEDGTVQWRKLAQDIEGGSHGLFDGLRRGSEPSVTTLQALARHAGISPLRLYAAAGWFDTEDVVTYILETDEARFRRLRDNPALLSEVLEVGPISLDAAELLARGAAPLLELLARQQRAERRRQLGVDDPGDQGR